MQQTSSGPAATCAADLFGPSSHVENRERVAPAEPTVLGGLRKLYQKTSLAPYRWVIRASATGLPEDFTCPLPLGGTGQYDWTSRRLHLSRHTGRASTSGRQKPSLVLSHWTGQDDWSSYKQQLAVVSFPLLCSGIWRE